MRSRRSDVHRGGFHRDGFHRDGFHRDGFFVPAPRFDAPALCAEADPDLWFSDDPSAIRQAQSICDECPNKIECQFWSVTHGEEHGIWGGIDVAGRRKAVA